VAFDRIEPIVVERSTASIGGIEEVGASFADSGGVMCLE